MTSSPHTDTSVVPFARRGSYFNIGRPILAHHQPLGPGLYVRTNSVRGLGRDCRELLLVELMRNGTVIPARDEMRRDRLIVRPADGSAGAVEMTIAGRNMILARGNGIGLRLSAPGRTIAQPLGTGRWSFNLRSSILRALLECGEGNARFDAAWERNDIPPRLTIAPAVTGTWSLAADFYTSTWVPRRRPSFDEARASMQGDWDAFLSAFGTFPRRWATTAEHAAHLLWACTVPPQGCFAREAVLMSRNWMDAVWSWDNWFNLVALAGAHPALALDQALLMADLQDEHGAYPDAVSSVYAHYNFSKPPVQGVLLSWLARHERGFLTPARARALYPTLERFTQWWLDHRRMPGDTLCHYLHGNDSGWDNSTIFDKGAPLVAPDLNAFLAFQAGVLARMARSLGRKRAAGRWSQVQRDLTHALVEQLWDGDCFVAVVSATGERVRCRSLIPCMPLVLGRDLPPHIIRTLVSAIRTLVTPNGVATEHPESPCYKDDGYWRGPVWGPSTMLTVVALDGIGQHALAKTIARNYCTVCAKSGFAENFDAKTGAPLRDRAYTWTASAFLALLKHL